MASGNQRIRQPHIISDDDDEEEEREGSTATATVTTTTSQNAEDRAFLNRAAKSIDTWQTFLEVQSSDQLDRTRLRLNAFVQRRQNDLRFYHPDPNHHSPHGEIGFEFLHGGGENPSSFAEWARQVRRGDYSRFVYTLDRHAIREVLFGLWDWLVEHNQLADKIDLELAEWMCQILCTILPFERAECLYKMKYLHARPCGMHWVSKHAQHTRTHPALQLAAAENGGRPAMNRRFVEIVAYLTLRKFSDRSIAVQADMVLIDRLLEPTQSPFEMDECAVAPTILQQLYRDPAQGANQVPLREEVYAVLGDARTINDFCFLYNSTTFMAHVHVLWALPGEQNLDDFAVAWATARSQDDGEDDAPLASEDVRTVLMLCENLSRCLEDPENDSVTHDSIRKKFKIQSLTNLLGIALPLGRALAEETNTRWPDPRIQFLCEEFHDDLLHLDGWLEQHIPNDD